MSEARISKQENRKDIMVSQPIPKVVISMSIPTILSFLITSIYNLADTYFVSSLGTNATAAVSVNSSLDQIIMIAGSMLAVGANSYIARLLGAKDEKKASKVLSTAFFMAMVFGAIVLVLGMTFMKPMVRLLGATDTCEQYSIQYATYILIVAPFMAANFVMNQCLRAEGNAVLALVGIGSGGILNCILDPIFIFVLDLGVAGASIATAISKMVSFLILIFPYVTRRSTLRINPKNIQLSKDIILQIFSVGSSSFFRSGMSILSAIILNNIAGNISDSVLAGIGVANKVMMFPFSIILGFGAGFQPVAGFNWGAKRYDRVKECFRFSSVAALVGSVIMGLLACIFAKQMINLFTAADADMLAIGKLCLRLQCIVLPIHAWVAVVNMFCAGIGKAKGALLLSTARQGSCFLPIVYPMALLWGANGLASVQAVADILTLALALPLAIRVIRDINQKQCESIESADGGMLPC